MRTVLLTGSEGLVGRAARDRFEVDGVSVRGFDLVHGDDLRDAAAVAHAMEGCDAVVHSGAVSHDNRGTPADIVATNVLGTWHVLLAAEQHRVERVVILSSVQVFGFAEGQGTPDYVPVDDAHPRRATSPYGMSKVLAEDMCETWTRRTGIPSIVLRPVMVLEPERLPTVRPHDVDLGAYVHIDDLADAIALALVAALDGHHRLSVSGPGDIDTSATRALLGWEPRHDWPTRTVRERMQSRLEILRRRVSAR